MAEYKVVEKFVSINGEGFRAGELAVFIRFMGCNLNCSYCDTAWANQEDTAYTLMTELQIYQYIKETRIKNVTLTGGEPLLDPNIMELLQLLSKDHELHVEIETNGSIDISTFSCLAKPPSFTMDYKLPGSLMEASMLISNFSYLTMKDTIKFVVGSIEDMDRAREIIGRMELTRRCHVYLSAIYGKIKLEDVVEYMKEHKMNHVVLQLQMHKVIWTPDKRCV